MASPRAPKRHETAVLPIGTGRPHLSCSSASGFSGNSDSSMVGTPNPALEAYLDKLRERFDKAAAEYKEKYVRDTFRAFDSDNGGTIDPEEFRRLCKRISPTMSEEDIAEALDVIDEDGDGEITFEEFEVWWNGDHAAELREAHEQMLGSSDMDEVEMVERWEGKQRDLEEAKLRRTFDGVDEDGSGEIEEAEFRRLCRRLDARLSDELIRAAWAQLDEDSSGAADFREFEAWWNSPNGRELRGVNPEDCPSWTYKELLAAVQARVDARAAAAMAEKEARKLRVAADKKARADRRAAKAAAIEAARLKVEEEAAETARLAEEERMQSTGYLKEMAQAAEDEKRRQKLLAQGIRAINPPHSQTRKRQNAKQGVPLTESRNDTERRWREQLEYQISSQQQHDDGKLPEVNVRGFREVESPSTGYRARNPGRGTSDHTRWRQGDRASALRRARVAKRQAADARAAARLRMSATADNVHSRFPTDAVRTDGVDTTTSSRDSHGVCDPDLVELGVADAGVDLLAGSHSASGDLATGCYDLFIANKDADKSEVLSAPAVGRRRRSRARDRKPGGEAAWLENSWMRRSGRLSTIRRIAREQLAMDIAADEKQKRLARAYAVGTAATAATQAEEGSGVASLDGRLLAKAGRRVRKRHDHPGRVRYPLIGATLRA